MNNSNRCNNRTLQSITRVTAFGRRVLGLAALLCLFALAAQANTLPSLAKILNPNGSINTKAGLAGSFDPAGYRLVTTTDGEPRFVAAAPADPADANWDARFDINPIAGFLYAVLIDGTDVYVGGNFTWAGGQVANNIVKWDGATWSPLGSGTDGIINALAMDTNGVLYAGGSFYKAGGMTNINNIARWNGASWSGVSGGVNGPVKALAVSGTTIYVGGDFNAAGGLANVNNIARWNGVSWSLLSTGTDAPVNALAVNGGVLYAGGAFTTAGGVSASRIARWDGATWQTLGSGMNGPVNAIVIQGANVIAGGSFTEAGGTGANRVALWDGSMWSPLGVGCNAPVQTLTVDGSNLYAGGSFWQAGGINVNRVAKWDGASWSSLGAGCNDYVSALASTGSKLYALGYFTKAGTTNANYIAQWDNTTWTPVGSTGGDGVLDMIFAVVLDNAGNLYVGGDLTIRVNGDNINYVARWDGNQWQPLADGVNAGVYAMAVDGTDLYVGGAFTTANNASANRVAKWDGAQWTPLDSGVNSNVYTLAMVGSDLYVGGAFTEAGGLGGINRIARWNGATWSGLGVGLDQTVRALAAIGADLYAGGDFTASGSLSNLNHVAKWNGAVWSALGSGLNDDAYALAVVGSDLYVGGAFTQAGGSNVNYVARWNGAAWSSLAGGVGPAYSRVLALSAQGTDLLVGGIFKTADNTTMNGIAKWDGANWHSYGSGILGNVYGIVGNTNAIYVVGDFSTAGAKSSRNFAVWQTPAQPVITTTSPLPNGILKSAYNMRLRAVGGTTPYAWTLASGSLPSGLILGGNGLMSGTPTVTGTNSFRVRVTDANMYFSEEDFVMVVVTNIGTVVGKFSGLVQDAVAPANGRSGNIIISVKKTGAWKAKMILGGIQHSFGGQFAADGSAVVVVPRAGLPALEVRLQQDVAYRTDRITGTVTDGTFTSTILADLQQKYGGKNPSPFAGTYTVLLAPADESDTTVPQGFGYGTLKISTSGKGKITGTLGDGTKLSTSSVTVSKFGTWPLYKALYANLGSCVGWLSIESNKMISASVDWFKPAVATDKYYPAGFTTVMSLAGDIYVSPSSGGPSIAVGGVLTLGGGNLASNVTVNVVINNNGNVTIVGLPVLGLVMSVIPATGQFTGSFVHPVSNASAKFNGVLLQREVFGGGMFLGTNAAGFVTFDVP